MLKCIDPVFYFNIISGLIALFIDLLPGNWVAKYFSGAGITAIVVVSAVAFLEVLVGKPLPGKDWRAALVLAVAGGLLWPVLLTAIFFVLMLFLPNLAWIIWLFGVLIIPSFPVVLFTGLPKLYSGDPDRRVGIYVGGIGAILLTASILVAFPALWTSTADYVAGMPFLVSIGFFVSGLPFWIWEEYRSSRKEDG